MDKVLAKSLFHLFSNPETKETLEKYLEFRIKEAHKALENTDSLENTAKYQGRIHELRYLLKTRENTLNILNKGET